MTTNAKPGISLCPECGRMAFLCYDGKVGVLYACWSCDWIGEIHPGRPMGRRQIPTSSRPRR